MNINELFEETQNEFLPEELKGEFLLEKNFIIWSYELDDDSEEINDLNDDDDEEFCFNFETSSSEELLLEVYQEDIEKINDLFDKLEETDNWTISDTNIIGNMISFKIY